jgi:hypothetical protein
MVFHFILAAKENIDDTRLRYGGRVLKKLDFPVISVNLSSITRPSQTGIPLLLAKAIFWLKSDWPLPEQMNFNILIEVF